MFEINVLVLSSITLLLIVVFVLFRLLHLKSVEVDRLKQVLQGTLIKAVGPHACARHFGYLNSVPRGKPLPSECMGCSKVFECLEHKGKREK